MAADSVSSKLLTIPGDVMGIVYSCLGGREVSRLEQTCSRYYYPKEETAVALKALQALAKYDICQPAVRAWWGRSGEPSQDELVFYFSDSKNLSTEQIVRMDAKVRRLVEGFLERYNRGIFLPLRCDIGNVRAFTVTLDRDRRIEQLNRQGPANHLARIVEKYKGCR